MKLVDTKDAVGTVLCHDITQIIKGVTKDARFRKGHVVKEEDIPVLLSLGKDHLYVWEAGDDMLHENDAARILCDLCKNEGMKESEVKEGKIELSAEYDGLLKIDKEKLFTVNSFGQMMIAARSGNTPVKAGDKLAGTRLIASGVLSSGSTLIPPVHNTISAPFSIASKIVFVKSSLSSGNCFVLVTSAPYSLIFSATTGVNVSSIL